jgi:lipopolysaccharide/colanic/teichoic acid biosynthesis glycosyltransferase
MDRQGRVTRSVVDLRTVDLRRPPLAGEKDAAAVSATAGVPRGAVPTARPVDTGRRHIVDRLLAGLLLVILLPVFLGIALLIKLGSRGPVLYSRPRVGLNGELFSFVKFRTMIPGADKLRDEVLGDPDDEMAQRYRDDPRITSVGHFLRRWSLDELPQLINIARGDMAFVGPRPMLPDEVKLLTPEHRRRHNCRPGLTGLWQVSGRKETTWDERMELDLHYVNTQSVRQDLSIVGRTFSVVLRGDGAY